MSSKPNLLIVGNFNRKDYLDLFKGSQNYFDFFFLEFAAPQEIQNSYYQTYGKAIFWGDFKTADDLLQLIKPQKVIFFFIESYYHVVLNLACKVAGISTYHLDHGLRDININTRLETYFIQQKGTPVHVKQVQKLKQLLPRLRARLFLHNSVERLPPPEAAFFRHFYKVRSAKHYLATFKAINSPLRVADAYIAFSPKVYEVHQQQDFLPPGKVVHFTGFLSYDHLADIRPAATARKQILFIDQGLTTRCILGWTPERYRLFIAAFTNICLSFGYDLYVKPHPIQPKQEVDCWADRPNVHLINDKELTAILPETPLIIGFFSTYLLPLMALPHTTVLTLENHPVGKLDVSKSFIEAGVAKPIYDLEELHDILPNIASLHEQQLPNKAKFTEEWLYKFDGKSGERLRDILLRNEL
ncbi:alpha-2,8-polysialyltransferase family protein [Pontibacter liquoris]|uniref:alpha-2,8-polysialyltransferase family protein n=1 Tax=Pontibacter liquoris TaxID=2905677 RepID=UPI001FA6D111|nr:alpha-2,8-polysialyltransferase family protein [Pontibacter liquoris]